MTQAASRHFARALLRATEIDEEKALAPMRSRFAWDVKLEPTGHYRWFLQRLAEKIERLGLRVSIEHDFAAFAAATPRMEGYIGGINPAFDPGLNDMSPERSFWLSVLDAEDRLVSCIAGKLFRVTSLYPMIESLAVWYDNDPTVPHRDERVEMLSQTPRRIAGTVSMTGRLWTHPAWRNRGLSSYLPLLARSMFLARHAVDFHFGFVALPLVRKNVPMLRYGFPRVEPCMRVLQRGHAEPIELHLVWMSRAELVADVEDAVSD